MLFTKANHPQNCFPQKAKTGYMTIEVGGEGKSFAQIADMPNSFVLADDIEMPHGSKFPLWMIGLTY